MKTTAFPISVFALFSLFALALRGCWTIDTLHEHRFTPDGATVELADRSLSNGPGWVQWTSEDARIPNGFKSPQPFQYTEWRRDDRWPFPLTDSLWFASRTNGGAFQLRIPTWTIAAAPLTIVAMGIRRSRAERLARSRFERGECVQCGYDLRGSTSGRCPECGAPAPQIMEIVPSTYTHPPRG